MNLQNILKNEVFSIVKSVKISLKPSTYLAPCFSKIFLWTPGFGLPPNEIPGYSIAPDPPSPNEIPGYATGYYAPYISYLSN